MKVWVIWDRLYEHVMSVHSTEKGCVERIDELSKKRIKLHDLSICYDFEADEFEVED